MPPPLNLALIMGSNRQPRLCDTVSAWAAEQVRVHGGFALDVLDPLEAGLPVALARTPDLATRRLARRIRDADACLVVTPEYNHGYPAPLKQLIDAVSDGWHAKPVAFVGYGGFSGGLRAIEQLRQVFSSLHTVPVHDCIALPHAWNRFDPDGSMRDPEACEQAVQAMLSQLRWWARALRDARQQAPYPRRDAA